VTALSQYRVRGRSASELADSLEEAIRRGDLRPGQDLPSVRTMAAELALSPTTVSAALSQLRARGLVASRARSRSFVAWRPPLGSVWPLTSVPEGVRDLAGGNPDPSLLPSLSPTLRRLRPKRRMYGAEPALEELLELARREFAADGIGARNLAVVSGALDGIERSLLTRLGPGDVVAVEDPGYPGVLDLCRALGLVLQPVRVDERGMLPGALADALRAGSRAVVITPRGQNPTGATLDAERARELRKELAKAPDVMVVEDDHLGPIAGAPRQSLVAGRSRWAAARSLAKSLGPDLRVAVLAGDGETIDRVEGRQLLGPQWVSHLLQQLAAELWSDERIVRMLARAERQYGERRAALLERLADNGIVASAPTGLNVWLPVPDEAGVAGELLRRGWAVAVGAPFRLTAPPAIRITVSSLEPDEAAKLAGDIAAALAPVRRTRAA
jgi:DNA-binding transcriptional MocR family regulator